MRTLLFIILLISCFLALFLGAFWNHFFPFESRWKEQIVLRSVSGEEIVLGSHTTRDTLLFSGYRNCPTICARTLPILQKIATVYKNQPLQVVFLDLTDQGTGKEAFLSPENFPNLKWILLEPTKAENLLSQISLERAGREHHSTRVLLQRRGTDRFQILENFSLAVFEDWFENPKKSLSSLSK